MTRIVSIKKKKLRIPDSYSALLNWVVLILDFLKLKEDLLKCYCKAKSLVQKSHLISLIISENSKECYPKFAIFKAISNIFLCMKCITRYKWRATGCRKVLDPGISVPRHKRIERGTNLVN